MSGNTERDRLHPAHPILSLRFVPTPYANLPPSIAEAAYYVTTNGRERQKSMRKNLLAIAVLILSACAEPVPKIDKPRDQMTERERLETVAKSGLPGAGVVGKALSISDAESRRAAAIDSAETGN
jgi:hypothetical protein